MVSTCFRENIDSASEIDMRNHLVNANGFVGNAQIDFGRR